jgi:hypothetical protein
MRYYLVTSPNSKTIAAFYERPLADAQAVFDNHNFAAIGPWSVIELRQVVTEADVDAAMELVPVGMESAL